MCIFIFNFLCICTVGDVPMGELVAGEQMEREPHELLHDFFFFYFVFYMKFYIYSHSFLKHHFLMFVCTLCTGFPRFA